MTRLTPHWLAYTEKSHHDANFIITGGTTGCHNNLWCSSDDKVVIITMPTLSSLAAPQVVIMTTCGVASDDKVGTMTTLGCQCSHQVRTVYQSTRYQLPMALATLLLHLEHKKAADKDPMSKLASQDRLGMGWGLLKRHLLILPLGIFVMISKNI